MKAKKKKKNAVKKMGREKYGKANVGDEKKTAKMGMLMMKNTR